MELKCAVQKYEWGKVGKESKVATLCQNANKDFAIDANAPYAELWMGTHPNGPSVMKCDSTPLNVIIDQNPNMLGEKSIEKFGKTLPFLFKILSINKALSIQAHPEKKHAEELHSKRPDLYKDPNHKPELAIALTPFEAMCGFRPINEIKGFINKIPELARVIESAHTCHAENDEQVLSKYFKALMTCPEEKVKEELQNILKRFSSLDKNERESQLAPLLERLYSQFPDDVGCFSIYFLNILTLAPFEAIYLGPNEPHAYIYGDCVECMACSDNVVRAGLTPKFKDVETLCFMLNYKGEPANTKIFKPVKEDEYTVVFKPPVPDFSVAKIEVPTNSTYKMIERHSASILLVVEGSGSMESFKLVPGTILFIKANVSYEITSNNCKMLVFQAFANV